MNGTTSTAHDGVFTRFVQALDRPGRSIDPASFDTAWRGLRLGLRRELRRRGLWWQPPEYLGIYGQPSWWAKGDPNALDDLAADCYSFIFVDRIHGLCAHLRAKPNIEGIVHRNIRHFVSDLQRRHDPLGARLFVLLHRVLEEAIAKGRLEILDGSSDLRPDCTLTLPGVEAEPVPKEAFDEIVEIWCDHLLPELITTRGKGQAKLEAELHEHLSRLPETGIDAFVFHDLLTCLRLATRRRWAAIFAHSGITDVTLRAEQEDGEKEDGKKEFPSIPPDNSFEARQSFRWLIDCMRRRLAEAGRDPRTQREMLSIWELLIHWATDSDEESRGPMSSRGAKAANDAAWPDENKPPSRRRIGQLLDIPRDRLPRLYDDLAALTQGCRLAARSASPPTPLGDMEISQMSEQMRARLLQATLDALGPDDRSAPGSRTPERPRAGEVYVLRATADLAVEWVILSNAPDTAQGLLAAPRDSGSLVGRTDLRLPRGGGTLRCGLALAVPEELFEAELRVGALEDDQVAAASEILRHLAEGSLAASVAQEEDELDPRYESWMEEGPRAARAMLESAIAQARPAPLPSLVERRREPRAGRRGLRGRWPESLAAVLAAVCLGLGGWIAHQQRLLNRHGEPLLLPATVEIQLDDLQRDPQPVSLQPSGDGLLAYLVVTAPLSTCPPSRIEILNKDGDLLWSRDGIELTDDETQLVLPRSFLDRRPARLRIFGECEGELRLLDSVPLNVRTEAP